MRRIAIGDVHGRLDLLQELWVILSPAKKDMIIFLGDLIDRGPDSKGVIDFIQELQRGGYNVQVIMGNHEDMCINASDGSAAHESVWLSNGGIAAERSYGGVIPTEVIDWMKTLPVTIATDDGIVFVHAGIPYNYPDMDESPNPLKITTRDFLLWARSEFHECYEEDWFPSVKMVVCGHTPSPNVSKSSDGRVICIDTGAVFKGGGYGRLTALDVDSGEIFQTLLPTLFTEEG